MNRLLGVRREDGGTVAAAFATLLTIVASHAVLETARDTLFLTHLSPTMLPWAYLGIASFSFVAARGTVRAGSRTPRRFLTLALAVGAAGTGVFAWVVARPTAASVMALYVWTGLLASVVVTQFWVELAGRMDVAQAKRGYAVVAAGGMLGAMLGSLLSGGILSVAGPRALLPAAAAMFALATCLPVLTRRATRAPRTAVNAGDDPERPGLAAVWADPYTKRLLLLAVIAPIVTMIVDYVFKSIVSQEVPKAELGPFFARYNTVVNGIALVVQLTLAPRLLHSFGVVRILCLLPGALGLVAAGVVGTAALPAALVLRGTDGTLRHSLHRAATEILFLPLPASTRSALRGLAESVGQRGGQVLGSLAILLAIAVGASPRHLAMGVAGLCGIWLLGYLRLQDHYVERFRTQLRSLGAGDGAVPDLDLRSIETLVASLGSQQDGEVIAAIDLLEAYGRERLISPLVLYHPSEAVVLRALVLFDGTPRQDIQQLRNRLLEHPEASVRAAVLRRLVADGCDRSVVRSRLKGDPSPLVRHTALVLWMGFDDTAPQDVEDAVTDLLSSPDPSSRLAVAHTLGELPPALLEPVARALLEGGTSEIRREIARSLAAEPVAATLPLLTELVAIPECRSFARAGLQAFGEPALEHLARALSAADTPPVVRRHLPRTISRFASARAAEILVAQLPQERDGRVGYKILRGLGRMRMDVPTLPVDRTALVAVAEQTLERLVELLAYRVAHELARDRLPAPGGGGGDLLERLLAEKERRALERVFRILQILEPSEDFATIFDALAADTPAVRATGRELIGHVLEGRFRDALLALTDSLPPAERLRAAASELEVGMAAEVVSAWRTAKRTDDASVIAALRPVLERLQADRSAILSAVARHGLAAVAGAVSPPEPEGSRAAS